MTATPAPSPGVRVTYFLEVNSSWCYWAEPTWAELRRRHEGTVAFEWKIAQMKAADYPTSREQCDWFYRRSGLLMRSPFRLNSGWFEPELIHEGMIAAPNRVAEAARALGCAGDEVRLALSHAAERDGRRTLRLDVAVEVAVAAAPDRLDPAELLARAEAPETAARIRATTDEFYAHQISQRPAFVLESAIGDKAVFSGLVHLAPLEATIASLQADAAGYAAHAAHHGPPPAA